jgi:hypothetical protein
MLPLSQVIHVSWDMFTALDDLWDQRRTPLAPQYEFDKADAEARRREGLPPYERYADICGIDEDEQREIEASRIRRKTEANIRATQAMKENWKRIKSIPLYCAFCEDPVPVRYILQQDKHMKAMHWNRSGQLWEDDQRIWRNEYARLITVRLTK